MKDRDIKALANSKDFSRFAIQFALVIGNGPEEGYIDNLIKNLGNPKDTLNPLLEKLEKSAGVRSDEASNPPSDDPTKE